MFFYVNILISTEDGIAEIYFLKYFFCYLQPIDSFNKNIYR